jgi:hypothetical protein
LGIIVIASYKPKPGKEKALDLLMEDHVKKLQNEGLVTDRPSITMKSQEGNIIEIFEWKSQKAIETAHSNPVVLKLWKDYAEVCEFTPLSKLKEASNMFAEFTSID